MSHRITLITLCLLPLTAQVQGTLKRITIPRVPGLDRYVRDPNTLVVLGKALFWDMQVGSDSRTACGTCHFHAGADHRIQHQLSNPGGTVRGNYKLTSGDFPFRALSTSLDNHSTVLRDSTQRAGSEGVFRRMFQGLSAEPDAPELAADLPDLGGFRAGRLNLRQVTPRNTPTVINAAFDLRTFWDGRASDVFTGRTPFGESDSNSAVVSVSPTDGALSFEKVHLANSSLASLAMGPPVNTTEMSHEGRTWFDVAKKLLPARPLALQKIAPDDSALGRFASPDGGLRDGYTYLTLIQQSFQLAYWDSSRPVRYGASAYTVPQYNFRLYFGLAIQAYLSTLVSDDSRFDQFFEGRRDALMPDEITGLVLFQTNGMCMSCHAGSEFTAASYTAAEERGRIEELQTGLGDRAALLNGDTGYRHTGVRAASEDQGLNALDDFGIPFSAAARGVNVDPRSLAIEGAFKAPRLRNIEFTGPYFHNGGQATLEQVLEFYSRGGDFPDAPDIPSEIMQLSLTDGERAQIIAFLKSLSDDRVRFERAPFDHPELCVPSGYPEVPEPDPRYSSSAIDTWVGIPLVGREGNTAPLQTYDELLRGIGQDGSRTHTLTDPCRIPAIVSPSLDQTAARNPPSARP